MIWLSLDNISGTIERSAILETNWLYENKNFGDYQKRQPFLFFKNWVSSLYGCKEKLDNVTQMQSNNLNSR